MNLKPANNNFNNFYAEFGDEKYPTNSLRMYEGVVVGEPISKVVGTVIAGAFIGHITTENQGIYHAEPAARYEEAGPSAHAIVYHEDDVVTDKEEILNRQGLDSKSVPLASMCGLSHEVVRNKIMNEYENAIKTSRNKRETEDKREESHNVKDESAAHKYTRNANEHISLRKKRQSSAFPGGKSECSLYMKTDQFLYNLIFNNEGKNVIGMQRERERKLLF